MQQLVLVLLREAGEDKDWDLLRISFHLQWGEYLGSRHHRQHHIEQDQVGKCLTSGDQAFLAIAGYSHFLSFTHQSSFHTCLHDSAIVDDENSHKLSSLRRRILYILPS